MDSIKGHSQGSGKGFLTTGPRIEAGNVVIHMGLYVSNCIEWIDVCLTNTCHLYALDLLKVT